MESFLIVQRGDEIGRRVDLNADQITIGRGSDNDVILNDPMVSRYHAVLKRQHDQYGVIDLGSSNPVVVNDQGLDPGVARQLAHRDVLLIGRNVFSFQQRSGTTSMGQASPPMQRPVATPPATMTAAEPTMPEHETTSPLANNDRTMLTPPATASRAMSNHAELDQDRTIVPSSSGASAPQDDRDKTMVGEELEQSAPPPRFAPPPPPAAVQFDDETPTNVGIAAPQADRLIGTPPSEEEGDLPTQIIPRR